MNTEEGVVFKYVLDGRSDQEIRVPCGGGKWGEEVKLLHVAFHPHDSPMGERLCVWVRVPYSQRDPVQQVVRLYVRMTGEVLGFTEKEASYAGTAITRDGSLVLHVWRKNPGKG